MIGVNQLYQKVEDTLVKNQSGTFSNDEFNLNLVTAQNDVFNFFMQKDGESSYVHDALQPFLETHTVAITQPIALPADYRSKRSAKVEYFQMVGDSPVKKSRSLDFLKTDEKNKTLESPVRGPSLEKEVLLYTIGGHGINIFPETLTGTFIMLYLRKPAVAVRQVTVDTVNEIEIYNPVGTVDLEWPEQYFNTFHEVICFYQGFQVRESEVIQWLSTKAQYDQRGK
jgi:hypothetical protein